MMRHKIWTKVLSVIMTLSLMLGLCVTAFASNVTYSATYTDLATKEIYKAVLKDANTEIGKQALNGNTVQEMYKIAAQAKAVLPDAETADFYLKAEPEIFAKLNDFMAGQNVTKVNADVLTSYFKEYPVTIKDEVDFTNKLNTFIDAFMTDNVAATVAMVLLIGAQMTPSIGESNMIKFFSSVDSICESIGVQQSKNFVTVLQNQKGKDMAAYAKNIIKAVLPDMSNGFMQIIKTLSDEKNGAKFYNGITVLIPGLYDMIVTLEPMIGQFVPGLDLSSVKTPLQKVREIVLALPTVGEGENTRFETEGCIEYLINNVLASSMNGAQTMQLYAVQARTDTRDRKLFSFSGDGMINFDHINLENVRAAADTTDVFNVVYHYLYKNLNKSGNKVLLKTALDLLPSLGVTLPKNVVDYVKFMLNNSEEESVYELYKMLGVATAREFAFGVDIQNGTGSGTYGLEEAIAIEADKAPTNKCFDKWVVVSGKATIQDPKAAKTTVKVDRDAVLKAVYKDVKKVYSVVEGANASWTQKSNEDLVIKIDGSVDRFTGIRIDGKMLSKNNYTVKAENGVTEITIRASYLDKLAKGQHKVTVDYTDGKCETTFTINPAVENAPQANVDIPKTGFGVASASSVLWKALAAGAVLATIGGIGYAKKRKDDTV